MFQPLAVSLQALFVTPPLSRVYSLRIVEERESALGSGHSQVPGRTQGNPDEAGEAPGSVVEGSDVDLDLGVGVFTVCVLMKL